MKKLFALSLVVFFAPSLLAAGWNKPYFAATKPGSWASYKTTSNVGPASTSTMTRLADHDGQVVIEAVADSSANRYELVKGFDVDHDLIDFLPGLVAASMSVNGGQFNVMPAVAITGMKSVGKYATNAVFKATETIDGKPCDHYTYSRGGKGDPTTETGDIWLNPSVPFGEVKHTSTTKDQAGKVLFTAETVLTGSGVKALPASTTAAKTDLTPQSLTLKQAYENELISVKVEIAPEDKRGDHLKMTIQSNGKPLTISVPVNVTPLPVDAPFDKLVFASPTVQKLEITPAKAATIMVNQVSKSGEQRVIAGTFTIHISEGQPMFQGSATSGYPK